MIETLAAVVLVLTIFIGALALARLVGIIIEAFTDNGDT